MRIVFLLVALSIMLNGCSCGVAPLDDANVDSDAATTADGGNIIR